MTLSLLTRLPLFDGGVRSLAGLEETDDAYLVEIELPGVKKGDIDISVAGRRLSISANREHTSWRRLFRGRIHTSARFYHGVVLPGEVDDTAVTASLNGGVLSVRVPKAASELRRRIEVH